MIGVGDEENILITLEHSSATTKLTDDVSNFIGLIHSFTLSIHSLSGVAMVQLAFYCT